MSNWEIFVRPSFSFGNFSSANMVALDVCETDTAEDVLYEFDRVFKNKMMVYRGDHWRNYHFLDFG